VSAKVWRTGRAQLSRRPPPVPVERSADGPARAQVLRDPGGNHDVRRVRRLAVCLLFQPPSACVHASAMRTRARQPFVAQGRARRPVSHRETWALRRLVSDFGSLLAIGLGLGVGNALSSGLVLTLGCAPPQLRAPTMHPPRHLPVVLARVNANHAPIKLRSRTNALAHVRAPSTRRLD
jgi:hypothetical protein